MPGTGAGGGQAPCRPLAATGSSCAESGAPQLTLFRSARTHLTHIPPLLPALTLSPLPPAAALLQRWKRWWAVLSDEALLLYRSDKAAAPAAALLVEGLVAQPAALRPYAFDVFLPSASKSPASAAAGLPAQVRRAAGAKAGWQPARKPAR